MKETLKHQRAFDFYYGMGEDRSCSAVAQKLGVSKTSVQNWSKYFKWQKRVEERDRQNARRITSKTDDVIVNARVGYQQEILKIIDRLKQLINSVYDEDGNLSISIRNVRDLKRAMEMFIQLVTLDLQLRDDTQQATDDVHVITEEELSKLPRETLEKIQAIFQLLED